MEILRHSLHFSPGLYPHPAVFYSQTSLTVPVASYVIISRIYRALVILKYMRSTRSQTCQNCVYTVYPTLYFPGFFRLYYTIILRVVPPLSQHHVIYPLFPTRAPCINSEFVLFPHQSHNVVFDTHRPRYGLCGRIFHIFLSRSLIG